MYETSEHALGSRGRPRDDEDHRRRAPADRKAGTSRARRALRWVLPLIVVAALIVVVRQLPVEEALLRLVDWVRAAGWIGILVFIACYVLATVLFLPGSILTLGAGFAYGVTLGTPIVWLAANLGAALAFILGRTVARERIAARLEGNPRFAVIDRAVAERGLWIVLLTRLSPVFPFNLLNYAFGLTRVTFRDYLVGSLVGMLPGTLMYVYLGSLVTTLTELAAGGARESAAQRWFYFAGLAVTVAVTLYVTRVARRALREATGEDEGREGRASGSAAAFAPGAVARRDAADRPSSFVILTPDDEHNRALVDHVHPPRWLNPRPVGRYNLVVIGGGTAGLVSAAGAAGLGAKVALVERHLLGGDCLNVGCVPSKALLHAARVAAEARRAGSVGVRVRDVEVDFAAVMERMRRLRSQIAPHDGAPRLAELGVDVFLGSARFTGRTTVEVAGATLEFARAVIATGGRPTAPPIPGLEQAGYLTNETVFTLTALPPRLAVIGGGPIGCELAQAFASFGSRVTILEVADQILGSEDADVAAIVARRLREDGVEVVTRAQLDLVERRGNVRVLTWERDGRHHELECDQILVSAGRAPNVEGLGLDAAGVEAGKQGVTVNEFLQTTNPRIYAAGDVASQFKFTHAADAQARIVLTNALFLGRKRTSTLHVPWCTYTTPEVAHVGLYDRHAKERGVEIDTLTIPLGEVDRAILEDATPGLLRVHLAKGSDRILGATLVGTHAGEVISELTLAITQRIGLAKLASVIHPYPTQAEVIRKAADAYNRSRLTPTVKKIFRTWLRLRR